MLFPGKEGSKEEAEFMKNYHEKVQRELLAIKQYLGQASAYLDAALYKARTIDTRWIMSETYEENIEQAIQWVKDAQADIGSEIGMSREESREWENDLRTQFS